MVGGGDRSASPGIVDRGRPSTSTGKLNAFLHLGFSCVMKKGKKKERKSGNTRARRKTILLGKRPLCCSECTYRPEMLVCFRPRGNSFPRATEQQQLSDKLIGSATGLSPFVPRCSLRASLLSPSPPSLIIPGKEPRFLFDFSDCRVSRGL
ncbi:hypothetical protein BO82DRAFT_354329, partial [Aspergillus uvarum CBS 121591]